MHDTLTIGIPVLVILFGILFNQRGLDKLETRLDARINGLEGRMDRGLSELSSRIDRVHSELTGRLDRMQSDINSRLDRMQSDLSMFYRTIGEHETEIDYLKKNRPD